MVCQWDFRVSVSTVVLVQLAMSGIQRKNNKKKEQCREHQSELF